jgi:hypothetical protein
MDGVLFSSSYQVFFTLLYYSFRDNVYATSYAPLVQDYEVCRYDELVVFYSYLGIASGDVSIIAPFWTLFFMGVLLFLQYICGWKIPKKISHIYGRGCRIYWDLFIERRFSFSLTLAK